MPDFLPMPDDFGQVSMIVEETHHYGLKGSTAWDEWLSTSPEGVGYVRLGDEDRMLSPSMFHQMHCLRLIQHALSTAEREFPYSPHHLQHCLNYIRQMVLCTPDLTLEPADMLERDFNSPENRIGMTHTCKDWDAIYRRVEENRREWKNHTAYQDMVETTCRWSFPSHIITS